MRLSLWLAIGLLLGVYSTSQAYFQDLGIGVRPSGMGEAYCAVADDSNAILYNVAGLAELQERELNLMYSDLYSNLDAHLYNGENDTIGFHNVSAAWPLDRKYGTIGFGWTLFNSAFYHENTFILGLAREVGPELFRWMNIEKPMSDIRLDAGVNFKVLNWQVVSNEFTAADPELANGGLSRTGFTADLAVLAAWRKDVKFGISLENFVPANVGVTVYETVPINFRTGLSYTHRFEKQLFYLDSLLGDVDFTQRNGISDIRAGVEGWFLKNLVGLRAGTTVDEFTTGLSLNAPIPNAPLDVRVDYAFSLPYAVKDTWGSHRVSLIVRWGKIMERAANAKDKTAPATDETEPGQDQKNPPPAVPGKTDKPSKDQSQLPVDSQTLVQVDSESSPSAQDCTNVRDELLQVENMIKLGVLYPIVFSSNNATIENKSFKTLDKIGAIFERHPKVKFKIDVVGQNVLLTKRRINLVRNYLLSTYKLNPDNIIGPINADEEKIMDANRPIAVVPNSQAKIQFSVPGTTETSPTRVISSH
jgi:outer membrane protein OmpA-like peptidoglycan-associated protein